MPLRTSLDELHGSRPGNHGQEGLGNYVELSVPSVLPEGGRNCARGTVLRRCFSGASGRAEHHVRWSPGAVFPSCRISASFLRDLRAKCTIIRASGKVSAEGEPGVVGVTEQIECLVCHRPPAPAVRGVPNQGDGDRDSVVACGRRFQVGDERVERRIGLTGEQDAFPRAREPALSRRCPGRQHCGSRIFQIGLDRLQGRGKIEARRRGAETVLGATWPRCQSGTESPTTIAERLAQPAGRGTTRRRRPRSTAESPPESDAPDRHAGRHEEGIHTGTVRCRASTRRPNAQRRRRVFTPGVMSSRSCSSATVVHFEEGRPYRCSPVAVRRKPKSHTSSLNREEPQGPSQELPRCSPVTRLAFLTRLPVSLFARVHRNLHARSLDAS